LRRKEKKTLATIGIRIPDSPKFYCKKKTNSKYVHPKHTQFKNTSPCLKALGTRRHQRNFVEQDRRPYIIR
jgi:hypothetical protein